MNSNVQPLLLINLEKTLPKLGFTLEAGFNPFKVYSIEYQSVKIKISCEKEFYDISEIESLFKEANYPFSWEITKILILNIKSLSINSDSKISNNNSYTETNQSFPRRL